MTKETQKHRMARRAREAARINTAIERLYTRSFKLPSFNGKGRFIDSIKRIQTSAFLLADNLKMDCIIDD